MKRAAFLLVALLLTVAGCASDPARAGSLWTVVQLNPDQRYLVFEAYRHDKPAVPLAFVLHGWGGEAESYGRLWHEALRGDYRVVALQAPPKRRGGSWISTWHAATDREFLLSVFDKVSAQNVDRARTVVIGYSSGAAVAALAARERRAAVGGLVLHGAGLSGAPSAYAGLPVFLLVGARDLGFGPQRAQAQLAELQAAGAKPFLHTEPADHASVYAKVGRAAQWILNGFTLPVTAE
ncbi:MAG TPA: alpha/beta fold hydrolase [bacterium]|nr:alpha/beta fold hydrolase [bacterium]